MNSSTRDIVLGGKAFAVPELPLRHNRVIYPLCRDLSALDGDDTFFKRLETKGGTPDAVRDDEWDKLIDIAFHAASAAQKDLSRDQFDDMPISPTELLDAFFVIRLQTGAWRASDETAAPTTEESEQGEGALGEDGGA